jgi:hypothetical protein
MQNYDERTMNDVRQILNFGFCIVYAQQKHVGGNIDLGVEKS